MPVRQVVPPLHAVGYLTRYTREVHDEFLHVFRQHRVDCVEYHLERGLGTGSGLRLRLQLVRRVESRVRARFNQSTSLCQVLHDASWMQHETRGDQVHWQQVLGLSIVCGVVGAGRAGLAPGLRAAVRASGSCQATGEATCTWSASEFHLLRSLITVRNATLMQPRPALLSAPRASPASPPSAPQSPSALTERNDQTASSSL